MVISPIEGTVFGISKLGSPKDIECVLCDGMIDVNTSFPNAKWLKNIKIDENGTEEERAQLREILVRRFQYTRSLSIVQPVKLILDSIVGLIDFDGTDYPAHDGWKYVVYTSSKLFKDEHGRVLYDKEFPVVAMVYDAKKRQLYEQSGVIRFKKDGARFAFDRLNTNMLWTHFTKLLRVGELVSIA